MPSLLEIPLYLLLATGLTLLIIGLIEPHLLDVEKVNWNQKGKHISFDAGNSNGRSLPRLRLVLLSDLHTEFNYVNKKKLFTIIKQAEPDLLIFAGDWTGPKRKKTLKKATVWQQELENLARDHHFKLIAVAGNHDDDSIRTKLMAENSEFNLLVNESMPIKSNDGSIWQIIGLDDLKHGRPTMPDSTDIPAHRTIIVAHNPDTLMLFPDSGGDYFLSGHFHGGQIWAPGKLEFKLFRQEKMAAAGFYRGEFTYNGKKCYISRGLGCVLMPIRLCSKPEITIIDIQD